MAFAATFGRIGETKIGNRNKRILANRPATRRINPCEQDIPGFIEFAQAAGIRPLPVGYRCPLQVTADHHNDDIAIDSYKSAAALLADKQRKGIREVFAGCRGSKNMSRKHYEGRHQFPRAPRYIGKPSAFDFISDSRPRNIAAFWGEHLDKLSRSNSALADRQKRWGARINPATKPAAGRIRTLTICLLADQCGLGGARGMGQFATGLPITGELSKTGHGP